MHLTGEHLGEAVSVWTSTNPSERVPAKSASAQAAAFTLNSMGETPVGIYGLRLSTSAGVSNMRLFMVDDLPTLPMSGQHQSPKTALPLELPTAVEASCAAESARYFALTAKVGQQVSIEVFARRLASPLDPVIRILDVEGKELAYADDEPGLMGDCRLAFEAPKDGQYLVELRDIRYAGGKNYSFRLRVGDFPLASVCYPPVLQRGVPSEIQPCVVLGREVQPLQISVPTDASTDEYKFGAGYPVANEFGARTGGSALLRVLTSDQRQTLEREPNDEPAAATALELPQGVSGRFQSAGDRDWYQFSADAGDQIQIEASSKQFGSPADVALKLWNADGKRLAESNPALQEEPTLEYAVSSAGQYRILVEELQRQAGMDFVYHLQVQKSSPGFALKLDQTQVNPPEQGVFSLPVEISRTHYQGEILLALPDLPSGCKLTDAEIPAGKSEATLVVQLPIGIPAGKLLFSKVTGKRADHNSQWVMVNLLDPVREELQWNVWPPLDLSDKLAIGIGPRFPEFLKLSLQPDRVVLPQHVGTASLQVKAERLHGFQEAIELKFAGLPPEIQLKGVTLEKGQAELNIELSGGEKLPVGETPFEITSRVNLQGQPQQVQLKGVLQVIPPLRVTLTPAGAFAREGKQKLVIKAERFGKESHPIQVKLENLPEGTTAPEEIVIPAGVNTIEVELVAALTVKAGMFPNIKARAVTKFGDSDVTADSSPVTLEIVEEEGTGNGK